MKADVDGCRIRTYRKKTGEEVFAKVPPFVIEPLDTAPHDSEEFYFWTGQGKLHTRTSKWGNRLQRLFVVANVRMVETEKRKRSGGKLKAEPGFRCEVSGEAIEVARRFQLSNFG
jgi:hypothetical protein